jgi:hypothetical protein
MRPVLSVLLNNTARTSQATWLAAVGLRPVRPRPDQAHLPGENSAPTPHVIFALGTRLDDEFRHRAFLRAGYQVARVAGVNLHLFEVQ